MSEAYRWGARFPTRAGQLPDDWQALVAAKAFFSLFLGSCFETLVNVLLSPFSALFTLVVSVLKLTGVYPFDTSGNAERGGKLEHG